MSETVELETLAGVQNLGRGTAEGTPSSALLRHNRAMARLVSAVQELSLARDLAGIMMVVRRAARELTGADGATFVLRDGDQCYYAEENAIAPLWKGQRFPMSACISGWVMLNQRAAVIEDIYADPRIPAEAYRPTFVRSLVMVPIRATAPIGAIGNYWAVRRMPTKEEVELLQALANTTAVAMENVQVYAQLEQRVKDRTVQLEEANRELEAFSYAVSHDLAAPLRTLRSFADLLVEDYGDLLSGEGKMYLEKIHGEAIHMRSLIDDLLRLSKVSRGELQVRTVNLSELAATILLQLARDNPGRNVGSQIMPGLVVQGDYGLLEILLQNLLNNAWKYTSKTERPHIEFGMREDADGTRVFFVRDNGAGFDMEHAGKLFQPFGRLHSQSEFPGTGVGLATVQRIVRRHGGRIWAQAAPNAGATFFFTLPSRQEVLQSRSL